MEPDQPNTLANPSKEAHIKTPLNSVLDHDFHSSWGSTYSSSCTVNGGRTYHLWEQYMYDPAGVERKYHVLLNEYTELFRTFFNGYYPISLHAHASDALLPTTIASLLLNTVATSPLVLDSPTLSPNHCTEPDGMKIRNFALDFLGWNETHVISPKFAVVDGIYGAGFGPLAHVSKEWEINAIASGPKPIVINVNNSSLETLNALLARAKQQGCIAVVADIVNTDDGSILSPDYFRMLKSCCVRNKLVLIMDETLTAIRCGAPFAFQRSEYSEAEAGAKPDLVVFGKGMGVSGIAIGFGGQIMRHLGFSKSEDIQQTIRYWRALVSRPIATPILIEALSILHAAKSEDWPLRSIKIGEAIRDIIRDRETNAGKEQELIPGLGAMIVVDRDRSMQFRIMAAIRRRSPWVRWLPKLDSTALDSGALETYVFGLQSKHHRQMLAEEAERCGTMPLWCFICGIEATSKEWCRACFLAFCNNEVCVAAFSRHICL